MVRTREESRTRSTRISEVGAGEFGICPLGYFSSSEVSLSFSRPLFGVHSLYF